MHATSDKQIEVYIRKKPDLMIELLGGDSRSRTDDPLLAKQVL